ncbi:hypothetical protein SteCoe_25806 [Stentor coeruleus]|uniref:Uncharacterized protein n=1 Tax=Stentor coeruleus TaxID=5963 RepID=A0A1R2BEH9_9CILI|nr:hypothetical protein SteCoe_25806 [Stentor coeruleus]
MDLYPESQFKAGKSITGLRIPSAMPPPGIIHQKLHTIHRSTSSLSSHTLIDIAHAVNIHRRSSLPKLHNEMPKIPSIISSALYLKKKSRDIEKNRIFKFKGGGFKGTLKKNSRIRSLLPTLRIEAEVPRLKKMQKVEKVIRFRKAETILTRTASVDSFGGLVYGKKLTAEVLCEL